MNRDFDQIRAGDKHQILHLQAKFDELKSNSDFNQTLITHHSELIKQLQDNLELTKSTSLDISSLQNQGIEINEKLENAEQDFFMKVEVIQK